MSDQITSVWYFIATAWPYIPGCFIGTFLLTFAVIKLSQSEDVYRWFSGKLEVSRVKRARQIRKELNEDATSFLRGRKEENLSPREQKIYFTMLESYYHRIEQLYGRSYGKRKR